MTPATVTETSNDEQHYKKKIECKHCAIDHMTSEDLCNNNNNIKYKKSPYDLALPKNDPKYMDPIRKWEKRRGFVTPIRWINTITISAFHIIALVWFFYHAIMIAFPKWQTVILVFATGQLSGFGVTGGAHRLWCHKAYKAKRPLQFILMMCYSIAGQNTIYEWVRDHRVHHKFSETSADPHDANRGFFFAHVGWLMMKKHPDVIKEGNKIDMSDILSDPWITFHNKYFIIFKILLCFLLPTLMCVHWWEESWTMAIISQCGIRYLSSLNFTWSVNSFAHLWGNKPYDKHIMPVENLGVSIVAMGEGWHNYHHSFPWDYKAAELGQGVNVTTFLLDLFAKIGWAYDLKVASESLVEAVAARKGDGSFKRKLK